MAAARVVLPTPPLPMVITSPVPGRRQVDHPPASAKPAAAAAAIGGRLPADGAGRVAGQQRAAPATPDGAVRQAGRSSSAAGPASPAGMPAMRGLGAPGASDTASASPGTAGANTPLSTSRWLVDAQSRQLAARPVRPRPGPSRRGGSPAPAWWGRVGQSCATVAAVQRLLLVGQARQRPQARGAGGRRCR